MFDLNAYLAERRALIEHALLAVLPAEGSGPGLLPEAMRHAVLTGGKRIRPILCLAAAEASGGTVEAALPAALAVELLHTYTLVHDDLPCMDNDLLRRGQPTVHARFGETLAVLAGDALQALAFEQAARVSTEAVTLLARRSGYHGVIAGQVADLEAVRPGAPACDRACVDYVFLHKTADLFAAAAGMGALPACRAALETYALNLGLAFQVLDDLLDAGQAAAGDELTCLSVMTEAEARAWARTLTDEALKTLPGLPGPAAPLSALAEELLQRVN